MLKFRMKSCMKIEDFSALTIHFSTKITLPRQRTALERHRGHTDTDSGTSQVHISSQRTDRSRNNGRFSPGEGRPKNTPPRLGHALSPPLAPDCSHTWGGFGACALVSRASATEVLRPYPPRTVLFSKRETRKRR
ncbi:zinc finger protein 471 isoform X4 [Moschus berezovskii]|uniref:zinc finger protein 471 isoform X4 n=1 Tax=Moschus berezovskii TaxID=68408 RepID=UPI002444292D|nr:zinc finger protein 471 isoform X4 [Moschus berezovskii]